MKKVNNSYKEQILQNVQMDTQTTFMNNGDINIYPCVWGEADKQKNNRGYAETQTGEQLDELLRQEWLRRDVTDIRAGREEKKDWLPFICPHYTANGMDTRGTRNMLSQWVYRGYLLQMTVFVK